MKKAFTLIELIMVIVIAAIISSAAMSYFREDKLQLAALETLETIRYAQHLALSDHKFDPKDATFKNKNGYNSANDGKYFKELWRAEFTQANGDIRMTVWSDRNRNGKAESGEIAKYPLDETDYNISLSQKYNIEAIGFSGGCTGTTKIVFDKVGRPLTDVGTNREDEHRITTTCKISIQHADGNETILIQPETGYAERQ